MRSISKLLQDKINKQNQTIFENADPKMRVAIARARSTVVDSSYWTVETIREGTNLGDIAVAARRQKVTGPPNKLFEIHLDNGEISTAIREYPDLFKQGWQPQFILGPGKAAAMAFNGHWHRYRSVWRLVTTDKPLLSWVDNAGDLYCQLWDETETRIKLTDSVKFVRMIRGWKNLNVTDKDQGVIVAYIKTDGGVYYRSYCEKLDGTYFWEIERQLPTFSGSAKTLNLFITNDYRMGFIVEDTAGIISWHITDRNWAGMASPADNLDVGINNIMFNVIPINYYDGHDTEHLTTGLSDLSFIVLYADSYYSLLDAENIPVEMINEETTEIYQDWGYKLKVKFNHDFSSINPADFALTDSNNIQYGIQEINKISGTQYEFTTVNFNNAMGGLKLQYNPGGATRGEAGQEIEVFSKSFDPINLVPIDLPIPKAVNIWNE